jgi:hypothetical protein
MGTLKLIDSHIYNPTWITGSAEELGVTDSQAVIFFLHGDHNSDDHCI